MKKFKRADPSRAELTMNRASQRAASISSSPTPSHCRPSCLPPPSRVFSPATTAARTHPGHSCRQYPPRLLVALPTPHLLLAAAPTYSRCHRRCTNSDRRCPSSSSASRYDYGGFYFRQFLWPTGVNYNAINFFLILLFVSMI